MPDQPADQPAPDRLVMMIVSDTDADTLQERLAQAHYPVTKVGSTGGFLRRGSVTIFSGVAQSQVDDVTAIVNEVCHARREFVPVNTLPFIGDGAFTAEPVEVRVGGAIVFVLPIERFERSSTPLQASGSVSVAPTRALASASTTIASNCAPRPASISRIASSCRNADRYGRSARNAQ